MERARGIFELAIGQPRLDMPEVLTTDSFKFYRFVSAFTNLPMQFLISSRLLCFQVLWKSYIDFEIEQEEFGNTRNLYKRLLQRTQHVKVRTAAWGIIIKKVLHTWKCI